ncbi:DUF6194 family protein [Kribbella sp. NPDC048928]|uniref:DUF6194 family protein n=1 Tax=Kribbella sp. NPDC048928 TaxID=3364111 RepID=UPI003713D7A5
MTSLDELDRILRQYAGVRVLEAQDDFFYLYDPEHDLPAERQQPFATIVTGDHYEKVSRLDEPGAFRLNLGVTKPTYVNLFGTPPTERDADWVLTTTHNYAARDTLFPHPFYASQYWIAITNPTGLDQLHPLIDEAYGFARRKYSNHRTRQTG